MQNVGGSHVHKIHGRRAAIGQCRRSKYSPRSSHRMVYSYFMLDAVCHLFIGSTHERKMEFLKDRIEIGKISMAIHTYLTRASSRSHDAMLKLQDAFFPALPSHNPLSLSAAVTQRQKVDFAKTLAKYYEYYSSDEYNPAWVSPSKTVLR